MRVCIACRVWSEIRSRLEIASRLRFDLAGRSHLIRSISGSVRVYPVCPLTNPRRNQRKAVEIKQSAVGEGGGWGQRISVASRRVVLRVIAGKGKACRLGRRVMLARARARVAFPIYQVSWRFLLSGPVTPKVASTVTVPSTPHYPCLSRALAPKIRDRGTDGGPPSAWRVPRHGCASELPL